MHDREQQDERGGRFSKQRRLADALLLISLCLTVNLAILMSIGIRLGGDSARYLEGAENLLRGLPLQERQAYYVGYELLIAFSQRIGIGLPGVVAIQLIMACVAAVALYDLGRKLHGPVAGVIAAGLFAVNPDIARWNAFILTDSLYTSLVVLVIWAVYAAVERKGRWSIVALAALLTATLVRPNGMMLMLVALLYLSGYIIRKSSRRLALSGIVLTFALGAIVLLRFYPSGNEDHPGMALRYGITGINEWSVSMPFEPEPPKDEWTYLIGYVARHPLASLRLGATRLAIALIQVRPFYSFRHNLLLLATYPVLYLLALMGLRLNRNRALSRLLVLTIIAHLALIAATYADWDGRFLLYVLPLVCLLSACTLANIMARYGRPLGEMYERASTRQRRRYCNSNRVDEVLPP